jgi:hypothetical protein
MSLEEKIAVFKHTKLWSNLPDGLLHELADVMYECKVR